MKVSVIIPLYNQKQFVVQAIESILNQSHKDFEIIVVNDGSTDEPYQKLINYLDSIKLINQNNMGLSVARNTGISHATGEFIQLLDADDFLHPDKLYIQVNFMNKIGARISYCEIAQLNDKKGTSFLRYIGPLSNIFFHLYNLWLPYPLPIHSLLFKREVFTDHGDFPINLKAAEDRYFLSMLQLKNEKFFYYPFIGGSRRLHDHNMNKDRVHIYTNMIEYYNNIHNNDAAKQLIESKYPYSCKEMMEANLTYMYLHDIINGVRIPILNEIKSLLKQNEVQFNYKPIPNVFGYGNIPMIMAFLKRFKRYSEKKMKIEV